MYLVFTFDPGGVYVPCVYSHVSGSYRRWSRCHVLCHVCQTLLNHIVCDSK